MTIRLQFLGAAGCVTGACFLLTSSQARVLVDCGMFQGPKTLKALNYEPFPFDPDALDGVLLTHAHIDHSGLIPKLFKAGYRGPVFATPETARLCGVLLPDAGAIQEMEVEALNKRRRRFGEEALTPIFTIEDARASLAILRPTPLDDWREIAAGVRARFWHAGHILGSASIEVEISEAKEEEPLRLLFSGDVGPGGRDLTEDPQGPEGVDHVIVEATYGGAERAVVSPDERRDRLRQSVLAAHAAGGPLLIPAFAVERTQELIVDLLDLMDRALAPPGPIFLDSPLAIKASNVFLRHGGPAHENPFRVLRESRLLQFTESADESRRLETVRGWHVIIAASGMCDAGRVRHHLKRLLWRPEATVLLVGYQPIGTLGRLLLDGRKVVRIQGDEVRVRANVGFLDIYSGHADGPALAKWVLARKPIRGRVFLTHGEPENLKALGQRLVESGLSADTIETPALDAIYALRRGMAKSETSTRRLTAESAARLDWHNGRADFLTALNQTLAAAENDAAREAILAQLKATLPNPAQ